MLPKCSVCNTEVVFSGLIEEGIEEGRQYKAFRYDCPTENHFVQWETIYENDLVN